MAVVGHAIDSDRKPKEPPILEQEAAKEAKAEALRIRRERAAENARSAVEIKAERLQWREQERLRNIQMLAIIEGR